MNWQKRGHVFSPENESDWMISHAMLPVPVQIDEDTHRVFFASRNKDNRSQVGYVDIDLSSPSTLKRKAYEPVVTLGDLGTFDDSGVFPTDVVVTQDKTHLYYVGWMIPKRYRYQGSLGLAISEDGYDTFHKYSKAPVATRTSSDPYMTLSSYVTVEDGLWKMWYTSAKKWRRDGDETVPLSVIKYAESENGIDWERKDTLSIDLEGENETRISRPSVIKENGMYRMWYCYASGYEGYRIGYAESDDGIDWTRKDDEAGIGTSDEGWDSEMVAYPYVFEHDGQKYMLYNGNGYGKTGFGYAVLE